MSPGVAGKDPSVLLHSLGNLFGFFSLTIQVKIRMTVQPIYLILVQIIGPCLIADICTISQDSVITGQCHNSFSSPIGKIRMLFYEGVQNRHHIVIAGYNCSVCLFIFTLDVSVVINYQLCGKTVIIHVMVIADIIFGKHKRNLAFRKHDLSSAHSSVIINNRHVMRTYQYVSLLIHTLNHLFKLADCCHHLIVSRFIGISVKSSGCVYNQ